MSAGSTGACVPENELEPRYAANCSPAAINSPLTEEIHEGTAQGCRGVGKRPWNLGLQFQRGLSNGDWELEERTTKVQLLAGRCWCNVAPVRAAKMEVSVYAITVFGAVA